MLSACYGSYDIVCLLEAKGFNEQMESWKFLTMLILTSSCAEEQHAKPEPRDLAPFSVRSAG